MDRIEGGQFGRVWNEINDDPTITRTGRDAYLAVTSFGERCWASQESIARRMKVEKRETARKGLLEMVKKGWLLRDKVNGVISNNFQGI